MSFGRGSIAPHRGCGSRKCNRRLSTVIAAGKYLTNPIRRQGSDNFTVSENEKPDQPLDYNIHQSVDSRAYSFAYLIHVASQLPADFLVDEQFELALFLPRELVPRFEQPQYVPRVLLLTGHDLVVYEHPECGASKSTVPFIGISHLELERFLTSCSLTIHIPGCPVHLPFHGRDQEHVTKFVQALKHRLRLGELPAGSIPEVQHFGAALQYKFKQIEEILNVDPKSVLVRFFVPPEQQFESRLFGKQVSWSSGTELVLTCSELHLLSDDKEGYRQPYGFRASWIPLRNVSRIEWDETLQLIVIRLAGGLSLKVPVPQNWGGEANKLLEFTAGHELVGSVG